MDRVNCSYNGDRCLVWCGVKDKQGEGTGSCTPRSQLRQSIDKSIGDSKTARSNTARENSAARRNQRRFDCQENRIGEKNTRAGDEAEWGYERREYGRERKKKKMTPTRRDL